jgi:hypothetical protein
MICSVRSKISVEKIDAKSVVPHTGNVVKLTETNALTPPFMAENSKIHSHLLRMALARELIVG